MFFRLDFEQYVPVEHQGTGAYYAYLPTDNKDFDLAADNETYLCYPLLVNGTLNAEEPYNFLKKELRPIRLPL